AAAVHPDLASDVAGRRTDTRLCRGVNYCSQRAAIGFPAIARALHEDLRGGSEIVVLHINVAGIVKTIEPHTIIKRNGGGCRVRSTEGIRAVAGVAAGNFRCAETHHSQIGNVHIGGIGTVHGNIAIASSRRHSAHFSEIADEDAAIRLTLVLEGQRAVSVWSAVCSFIPAPQVKTARNSADRFDIDRALWIYSHAGLDRLSRSCRQTQTLIGRVIRCSWTHVRGCGLTIRAVVLTSRVGRWSGHSHIDSNLITGNAAGRIEPDGIPE